MGRGCVGDMPHNIFSDKKAPSEMEMLYEQYSAQMHAMVQRRAQLLDRAAMIDQEIDELEATMGEIRKCLLREASANARGAGYSEPWLAPRSATGEAALSADDGAGYRKRRVEAVQKGRGNK